MVYVYLKSITLFIALVVKLIPYELDIHKRDFCCATSLQKVTTNLTLTFLLINKREKRSF